MVDKPHKTGELREREQELSSILTTSAVVGSFGSNSLYKKALQGKAIHELIAFTNSEKAFKINNITHTGTAKSDELELTLDENVIGSFSPQTVKGIILLITKAAEQLPHGDQATDENVRKSREIEITLDDYKRLCNIRDNKTAREQLNSITRTIYGISLKWKETEWNKPDGKSKKVKTQMEYDTRIIDTMGVSIGENPVKCGRVKVKLAMDIASYLATRYIMPYHSALLTINTQYHPYSVHLGWKLSSLYNMNWGKPTQGKTTVETLLKAVNGMPRYESIAAKGQVYDRIIKPFDRDMKELVERGILSDYYYYDDMGTRVDNIGSISYIVFKNLNIWYELKEYPSQAPRLEAKQKRIRAAINRAKRAAKKKQEEAEAQAIVERDSLEDD